MRVSLVSRTSTFVMCALQVQSTSFASVSLAGHPHAPVSLTTPPPPHAPVSLASHPHAPVSLTTPHAPVSLTTPPNAPVSLTTPPMLLLA